MMNELRLKKMSWGRPGILLLFLCVSLARAERLYPGKEVIAEREWHVRGREEPVKAKVRRWFAGSVTLSLDGRRVRVPEDDLSAEDREFLEKWDHWHPRRVSGYRMRRWDLERFDEEKGEMVPWVVTGSLEYLVGSDALIEVSGKRELVKAGQFPLADRRWLGGLQRTGRSVRMEARGYEAESLRALGLESFRYEDPKGRMASLPYRLFVPEKSGGNVKVPLVVFLHGLGEAGTDNVDSLKWREPLVFISEENQEKAPCFFLAPQHPAGGMGWQGVVSDENGNGASAALYQMNEVVKELCEAFPAIDRERIYTTGLSSGAMGAYEALSHWPETYAAAIPIAEAVHPAFFTEENAKPMWILYNEGDIAGIRRDVERLAKHLGTLGERPRVTTFDKGGHNAWAEAYGKSGIVTWLFRQRLRR